MLRLLLLLVALCASAQTLTYRAVTNGDVDLYGTPDTAGYGGFDDVAQWNITFKPPAGYGVLVISVHGDLVSWIKSMPGDPVTPPGSTSGVLLGVQSTPNPTTSGRCDYCSDSLRKRIKPQQDIAVSPAEVGTTIVYIQDSVSAEKPNDRATYDEENVNMTLQADNKLLVTVSSWCNVTGKPIHVEPTFYVVYQWVPLP